MNIIEPLTHIFRAVFDDEDITLTREMNADDIDGWDSFAHLNLLMSIEEFFEITISDEEAPGLRNVGDLMDIIKLKT